MIFLVSSSTEISTPRKPESYHHGNLRQALLEAARALAAEVGVDAFTLREVARRAGVSHAAPYHHFHDKAALVRALAIEAFAGLAQDLLEAAQPHTDPFERFKMMGLAYVRFALKRPSEFRFMFRKDLCLPEEAVQDELEIVSRTAHQVLVDGILACQRAGQMPPEDTQLLALTAWSTMHGLASLLLDAPIDGLGDTPEQAEGVANAVARILGIGLMTRDNTVQHANQKHRPGRSSRASAQK
jgi:AcrR family transcriptional regulator